MTLYSLSKVMKMDTQNSILFCIHQIQRNPTLTLNNGNVSMSESTDDKNKQLWIAECRGQVKKDSDGDVEEAAFYLKNLASSNSGSNDYLTIENNRVTISSDPVPWLLSCNDRHEASMALY